MLPLYAYYTAVCATTVIASSLPSDDPASVLVCASWQHDCMTGPHLDSEPTRISIRDLRIAWDDSMDLDQTETAEGDAWEDVRVALTSCHFTMFH